MVSCLSFISNIYHQLYQNFPPNSTNSQSLYNLSQVDDVLEGQGGAGGGVPQLWCKSDLSRSPWWYISNLQSAEVREDKSRTTESVGPGPGYTTENILDPESLITTNGLYVEHFISQKKLDSDIS